jgi:hypothetical protein
MFTEEHKSKIMAASLENLCLYQDEEKRLWKTSLKPFYQEKDLRSKTQGKKQL